jgi:ubiquinone/menaquinone biosynthesis C-methylase UbiE/ribosomal protein S18 acetylase RimI-like enzyme
MHRVLSKGRARRAGWRLSGLAWGLIESRPMHGAGQPLTLQARLNRTEHLLKELGPLKLAGRVAKRCARVLFETGSLAFFIRKLDESTPAPPWTRFQVRQLLPSERESLLHGSESSWETLRARFQRGDLCFGALDAEGRAVHTRWLTFDRAHIPELDLDFVPPEGTAYFYDGYTRPDARRLGVDAAVRSAIFNALRARGCRGVYSYVRDDNPGGLRAATRCQQEVGRVRFARFLASRPFVSSKGDAGLKALLKAPAAAPPKEADERAAKWRQWFEGWLQEPVAKRSIGFHQLPEEAFTAMANHIAATLSLTPDDSVLDVGCDSALVTRHVRPRCSRLTGVDFIPGMLIDAQRARGGAGHDGATRFAAADGRALPFPGRSFTKAYCSGVVHTLPTHEDSFRMILEMVRVAGPGGTILVAAIPDVRKRWRGRIAAWKAAGVRERAQMIGAWIMPSPFRRLARRVLNRQTDGALRYLEFDLVKTQESLRSHGLLCAVLDYPANFWSRDFRETRSNLLISVPLRSPQTTVRVAA